MVVITKSEQGKSGKGQGGVFDEGLGFESCFEAGAF